jgi:hypothetical protein
LKENLRQDNKKVVILVPKFQSKILFIILKK